MKPPVYITREQFDTERRFVIGAGLNHRLHRAEVDMGEELLLFPKPVPPRARIPTGGAAGDYEMGSKTKGVNNFQV